MKYSNFKINLYKGLRDASIKIGDKPIPIIGLNESGKSSALEAICRFDFRNDEFATEHQWEFYNRYNSSDRLFSVEAKIQLDQNEVESTLEGFTDEEMVELRNNIDQSDSSLVIKRFFQRPNEIYYSLSDEKNDAQEALIRKLIPILPRLFYFDSFLEGQFPDSVDFADYAAGTVSEDSMNDYQQVIRIIFDKSGKILKEFLAEDDCDIRKNILDEINKEVSKILVDDWKKMHVSSQHVDVALQDLFVNLNQDTNRHEIRINISEKFKDESGTMRDVTTPLSRRSLGFRWFFNFSLKKNFGSHERRFVYLLDEPGSYLHNSAQSVLLQAIVEMAQSNPVIYATHSEFLLDPELININLVKVAEKKDRQIKLTPVSEVGDTRIDGALSTIYNAIRIRTNLHSIIDQKIIVTEGITDFYLLRMLSPSIVILPGFGAKQNQYLLSMAIGCSKKYLAIFDGDKEGNEAIEKYMQLFSIEETNNWKQYLNKDNKPIKLEKYFSKADAKRLTDITKTKDIKSGVTHLFYSEERENFWTNIDDETKSNLASLLKIIQSHLDLPSNSFII